MEMYWSPTNEPFPNTDLRCILLTGRSRKTVSEYTWGWIPAASGRKKDQSIFDWGSYENSYNVPTMLTLICVIISFSLILYSEQLFKWSRIVFWAASRSSSLKRSEDVKMMDYHSIRILHPVINVETQLTNAVEVWVTVRIIQHLLI